MVTSSIATTFGRVARGSIFLAIDQIITAITGGIFWIVVGILIPPEEVGMAVSVLALSATLMVVGNFGLGTAIPKFVSHYLAAKDTVSPTKILKICLSITLGSSTGLGIFIALTSAGISSFYFHDFRYTNLLIALGLTLPFASLFRILYSTFQGILRMEFCLIADVIYIVARFVFVLSLISLGSPSLILVIGSMVAYVFPSIISALIIHRKLFRNRFVDKLNGGVSQTFSSIDLTKQLFAFALPNYTVSVLSQLSVQLPLILLSALNSSVVAYYNIVSLVVAMISSMSLSVSMTLLPTISAQHALSVKDSTSSVGELFNLTVKIMLVLLAPVFAIVMVFPDKILSLIRPSYALASFPLQVLVISSMLAVVSTTSGSVLNGLGKPNQVMMTGVVSNLLGILLMVITIPNFGMVGASVSTVLGSITALILNLTFLKKTSKISLSPDFFTRPIISVVVSILISLILVLGLKSNPVFSSTILLLTYGVLTIALKSLNEKEISILVTVSKHFLRPDSSSSLS
jgi:O-antigen/teichoic acid export membrane protein